MANHVEKHLGNSDTEDSRTKKKGLCFEVCALCLSSTMAYKSNFRAPRPSEQIKVQPSIAIVKNLLVDNIDGHVIYVRD